MMLLGRADYLLLLFPKVLLGQIMLRYS
uniref:Uncharacterized protein n=1 Tax=Arundo donax TaxID=35708 RepID=A0A0A9H1A0_ARUDO